MAEAVPEEEGVAGLLRVPVGLEVPDRVGVPDAVAPGVRVPVADTERTSEREAVALDVAVRVTDVLGLLEPVEDSELVEVTLRVLVGVPVPDRVGVRVLLPDRVGDVVNAGVPVVVPDCVCEPLRVPVLVMVCVWLIVALMLTRLGVTVGDVYVPVDVGVGSGVDANHDAFCGGRDTPRNTLPAGALASTVTARATVSYEYSRVRVVAYRMNDEPPLLFRPAMEYTASVLFSRMVSTTAHAPATSVAWWMLAMARLASSATYSEKSLANTKDHGDGKGDRITLSPSRYSTPVGRPVPMLNTAFHPIPVTVSTSRDESVPYSCPP